MPRPPGRGRPQGTPAAPAVQQRALLALALGLVSMFGLFSVSDLVGQLGSLNRTLILVVFSLVTGGVGAWLGRGAKSRARNTGTARPRGATSAVVLGSIAVLFSILLLIAFTVFSKEFSSYSRCMKGANTLTAQQACKDQLTRSLNAETSRIRSR
jgi:hypothetical protein